MKRQPARRMPSRRVSALILCLLAAAGLVAGSAPLAAAAPAPGPFVTFLFSRTELTAAVDCVPNDDGIARLDTTVARFLSYLGMSATGSLQTAGIGASARNCTHYRLTIMASWADAAMLSTRYGWSFVSHTATYPTGISTLSPQRQWDETCGSAGAIDAHGLRGGHGLIAYPGAGSSPLATQQNFGQHCFAWGRRYDQTATTYRAAAGAPPYWQTTGAFNGGPCNAAGTACYDRPLASGHRYTLPGALIARINALGPGSWATLQAFVLVTGSTAHWNCTAGDPRRHWTDDNERYCYKDFQAVARAVQNRPVITVTDPLTAGIAWGRPATYSFPRP